MEPELLNPELRGKRVELHLTTERIWQGLLLKMTPERVYMRAAFADDPKNPKLAVVPMERISAVLVSGLTEEDFKNV
jgi:hypothetical protein